MPIFFTMVPKRKEHSNDLRSLVIKYLQNGDSQRAIATKTLLPRETARNIINKYKRMETYSVEAERKRPQQQLTERLSIYGRRIDEHQLKRWQQRSRNSWIYH